MKHLFLATAFLFIAFTTQAQDIPIQKINTQQFQKLTQQTDAVYVINVWATWCGPCVKELPTIEKLAQEYKDKNVKVLLVSLDYPNAYPKKIEKFAEKHNLQSPIYWLDESNPNAILSVLDKNWHGIIPCTLFINNKKGYRKFVEQQIQPDDWKKDIEAAL